MIKGLIFRSGLHEPLSHTAKIYRVIVSMWPQKANCVFSMVNVNTTVLTLLVSLALQASTDMTQHLGNTFQELEEQCGKSHNSDDSILPRLGSYSLINLLVRNFTVSAVKRGGERERERFSKLFFIMQQQDIAHRSNS